MATACWDSSRLGNRSETTWRTRSATRLLRLDFHDLGDAAFMATAFERRGEEGGQDLLGERFTDDSRADAEHIRVVVRTRHAGRVEVVAERGANAVHLVGCELFTLPAATEHDAELRAAVANSARDRRADRRVVDARRAVGAEVDHCVALVG